MEVRLFDFQTVNRRNPDIDEEEHIDAQLFVIQMFGINEDGDTFSIEVHDFKPYFYCLVSPTFTREDKNRFVEHIKQKVGHYYSDSIMECVLLKKKKLDGFAIKEPVFSFDKFPGVNKELGPEMKSTGEAIRFIKDLRDPYFRNLYKERSMNLSR